MKGDLKMFGYEAAMKALQAEFEKLKSKADKAIREVAKDGSEMAKEYIKSQPSDWQPLSDAYRAQKRSSGLSGDTMIRHGDYLKSIKFEVKKSKSWAGVPSGARNKRTGDDIVLYAKVHEYGSRTIGVPARPTWLPVSKKLWEKWSKKNIDDI